MSMIGTTLTANTISMGKRATNVAIYCGSLRIGVAVLGGRWNNAAALLEFKRLPTRFKPCKGFTQDGLKACAAKIAA